jgi:hypothetical protein
MGIENENPRALHCSDNALSLVQRDSAMRDPVIVKDPGGKLEEVADMVCSTNQPVTIETQGGNAARMIPVPKPIGFRKGVPNYRPEDMPFLFLDYPYWFENNKEVKSLGPVILQ